MQGIGSTRLLTLIDSKLKIKRKDILLQALYILVNLATGGSLAKGAIMSQRSILEQIRCLLSAAHDDDIKLASVWCVINLSWPDDEGSDIRVSILREIGLFEALKQLSTEFHISSDLNDRTSLAMEHFEAFKSRG